MPKRHIARRRRNPDGTLLWVLGGLAVAGVGYWLYTQGQNAAQNAGGGGSQPATDNSGGPSNPVNNTFNQASQDIQSGQSLLASGTDIANSITGGGSGASG